MQDGGLRSERSERHEDPGAGGIFVVGDAGLAGPLAVRLGARHLPDLPEGVAGTARLDGARAIVLVGHTGDFEHETRDRRARRAHLVEVARRSLAVAQESGAHLVLVSSAMVCGARPGGELISDDESVAPEVAHGHGIGRTLVEVESVLGLGEASADDADPAVVTVVRCAPLVGPGADTLVTRHFEAPRLLAVSDAEREWQFLHVDDLAAAIRTVLAARLVGTLTAGTVHEDGTPDVLGPARAAALAGRRPLTLPRATAFAIAEQLYKVGAVPAPPDELSFAVYSWTVTAERLFAAGWRPTHDAAECVVEASGRAGLTVAGRRLGGRDAAALGAAGAAVALLGTAAAWRQARGRH